MMATLPALPPGFEYEDEPKAPRRARSIPPLPPGFEPEGDAESAAADLGSPTGDVHDGDTFRLSSGVNARLSGVDAFELDQTGRRRDGSVMPLGTAARDFLESQVSPNSLAIDTGGRSYNRPVMMLKNGGQDVGPSILRTGNALAAPEYLRGDPRLPEYMEAERLARLNRQGAFAGQFQSPTDFRRGKPDPWQAPEIARDGHGVAVFSDEPTPFQGLRSDVAQGYIALASDPKSTAADLIAYADANGFTLSRDRAEQFIKDRSKPGARVGGEIQYEELPQVLTNMGDGVVGAAGRGFADPINMLDELGGVVDTLGGTDGRENVWNSDRRFGDVLWNNIDQNRDILAYDDAFHPYARFGGQVASAFAIPAGSVEGVGLAAARNALRAGATRSAAEAAAASAVTRRLALTGGAEGTLAGFGAGEGNPLQRTPNALLGAGIGVVGGTVLGVAAPYAVAGARRVRNAVARRGANDAQPIPEGFVVENDTVPAVRSAEALPSSVDRPAESIAAMDNGIEPASITAAPFSEVSEKLDSDLSPIPEGFVLEEPDITPRSPVRAMSEQATPDEIAALARTVNPEDVTPIPANAIESLDEAVRANPGPLRDVEAPDERANLPPYRLTPNSPVRRDPIDLVGWLRTKGGIREEAGELARSGIDNKARPIDFAKSEGFLGRLINDEGMRLDEAAVNAWEAGFFPDHVEPPTVAEFLDALRETYRGGPGRVFHPDDYETLDAFNAARAQRGAVETAAQEGSPLAEDIGRPIGLDDLDANQPPVTAYEDLPSVGGKAGNIRLDKLETRQDIRRALMSTDARVGGFDPSRRGKISQGETEALARELNMTADDLLRRRQGQALNAEQALAARSILARSGDELVKLAEKVKGGSDEDIAAFRRAWVRHVAIQEQVSGATAEAGRALAQFKMMAKSRAAHGRVLEAVIQGGGGKERLEDIAETILDLQREPGKLNRFARDAMKPKLSDKLVELWYNSLLSGPQTHAVNVLSNSLTSALQIPEHATAAVIGQIRRRSADRVLLSETGARAAGLMQGTKEGLRAFARTLKTGQVPDHVTKVEAASQEAISGLKGKIIRTPTRLLSAEDELFKAIARRMEVGGLAMRKARAEGLRGDAFKARVADLTTNPTDEMFEKSLDYARYVTFQRPLGGIGQKVSGITQEWPALKLFLPFIRTPTNIFKFVAERSPAAFALKEVRRDLAKGGAARDLAAARMLLGTGLGFMAAQWAQDGVITGAGPADEGAKAIMRADGWQPYSLKLGGKYYSYQRFDPIASTLGVAADMVETDDYMTDAQRGRTAATVIAAVVKNLSNKVWLSGITDIAQALDDPERYMDSLIARLAGAVAVPAVVAQTEQALDPVAREARSPTDRIRSRIPVVSERLPPRRDVWGEEIHSDGRVGPDFVSPVIVSRAKDDPVNAEMLRLGASIGRLDRKIAGRELSPLEFNRYQEVAGKYTRADIEAAMADPSWASMADADRVEEVEAIKRAARKAARQQLFGATH